MAPIFKGDKEVTPGELKLGNQDVKEVYLGSEKIWPAGPPPGVNNVLWTPSKDPAPLNMVPTLTVTRNARVPSGTPPNIASTTAEYNNYVNSYQQCALKVTATNPANYTAMQNPQMRVRFMVRDWVVGPTDLNCYIKITLSVSSSGPDYTSGTPKHRLEGELSFGGAKKKILEMSGGGFYSNNVTFTTTQTINEYIENRQYLDFTHTWSEGSAGNYNRFVGAILVSELRVSKIEAIAAGRRRPIKDLIKKRKRT